MPSSYIRQAASPFDSDCAQHQRLNSSFRTPYTRQSATVPSVWPWLGRGTPEHHPCSPLSHPQFFSTSPEDWTVLTLLSRLAISVIVHSFVAEFTTLKSLDYNVVMLSWRHDVCVFLVGTVTGWQQKWFTSANCYPSRKEKIVIKNSSISVFEVIELALCAAFYIQSNRNDLIIHCPVQACNSLWHNKMKFCIKKTAC